MPARELSENYPRLELDRRLFRQNRQFTSIGAGLYTSVESEFYPVSGPRSLLIDKVSLPPRAYMEDVLYFPVPQSGLNGVPLRLLFKVSGLDDPIQVVLPASHPAAAEPALELADLADEAWIDSTTLSSCHPFLRRACNAAGFEPRIAAETNDHRTLHHLVASGVGLAVIPLLSQLDLPASLVARSIRTNPPKRRIHAAFRSGSAEDARVQRLLERLDAAAKSRPAALDLVRAGGDK